MQPSLYDVTDVQVLGHYRLRLTFADGLVGDVDLSHLQRRGGVFKPLRNPRYFAQAHVDKELGTVVWPNGADLAPEVLYEQASRHRHQGRCAPPGGALPSAMHAFARLLRGLGSARL